MTLNNLKQITPSENSALWKGIIITCLIIKPLIFYNLMDIRINLLFLWAATALFFILIFGSFRKPAIPFGLYVVISILMFCDIVYNSYFHGYLSLDATGSAKYLPEVWDVIKEVIQPKFWLIFWDLPLLAFGIFIAGAERRGKRWPARVGLAWALTFLILGSASYSSFLRSAGNLEFFSAHGRDIIIGKADFAEYCSYTIETASYSMDSEDKLFGIGKDRNLIVLQMEALQNFVINREYRGQEITPVLNGLCGDEGTIYFDNYYMQIGAGNTSDAEFATNNSIYGSEKSYTYELYKENTYRGLPVLLKETGYSTVAMHGYEGSFWSRTDMYPAMGFDEFIDSEGYEPDLIHGWGIADEDFYEQSVQYLQNQPQPFYSFMVSLSNHTPFIMEKELSKLRLAREDKKTRFGNYLNSTAYSDYAVGVLIEELKKAGLYENSIIAIYGDHFGLSQKDEDNEALMTEFLGKPYRFDAMANVPLIIHIPGAEINRTISIAGGQLDFMPTLAYLMGLEVLDTIYLGQNLITAKEGFVAQNRYAPLGSFITDELVFFMSFDGVFENGEAWRIDNGKKASNKGLKPLYERSVALITESEKYLEEDFIAGKAQASTKEDAES